MSASIPLRGGEGLLSLASEHSRREAGTRLFPWRNLVLGVTSL